MQYIAEYRAMERGRPWKDIGGYNSLQTALLVAGRVSASRADGECRVTYDSCICWYRRKCRYCCELCSTIHCDVCDAARLRRLNPLGA